MKEGEKTLNKIINKIVFVHLSVCSLYPLDEKEKPNGYAKITP